MSQPDTSKSSSIDLDKWLTSIGGMVSTILAVVAAQQNIVWGVLIIAGYAIFSLILIFRPRPVGSRKNKGPIQPPLNVPATLLPGEAELQTAIDDVTRGLKKARAVRSAIFFLLLTKQIRGFLAKVEYWQDGKFEAQGNEYAFVLRTIYEHADDVFSTSLPDYLSIWTQDLGRQLINAHRVAKSKNGKVTRIFIFDNWEQIAKQVPGRNGQSDTAVRIMEKQNRYFDVRVYVDEGNLRRVSFPPESEYSRDFTIINNGEAIAETLFRDTDPRRAEWEFAPRPARKQIFLGLREELMAASDPFEDFKKEYQARQNDPGSLNP